MATEASRPTIWGLPVNAVARALGHQTEAKAKVVVAFIASKGVASSEKAIAKQVYRARRCMNPEYKGNDPVTGYFSLGQVPTLATEQIAEFEDFAQTQAGQAPPVPAPDEVRASRFVLVDENGTPRVTLGVDKEGPWLRLYDEKGAMFASIVGRCGLVGLLGQQNPTEPATEKPPSCMWPDTQRLEDIVEFQDLSVRSKNRFGPCTVGEMRGATMNNLYMRPGVGKVTVFEVAAWLHAVGIWPRERVFDRFG